MAARRLERLGRRGRFCGLPAFELLTEQFRFAGPICRWARSCAQTCAQICVQSLCRHWRVGHCADGCTVAVKHGQSLYRQAMCSQCTVRIQSVYSCILSVQSVCSQCVVSVQSAYSHSAGHCTAAVEQQHLIGDALACLASSLSSSRGGGSSSSTVRCIDKETHSAPASAERMS